MTLDEARVSDGEAVARNPESDYPEVGWIAGVSGTKVLVGYGIDKELTETPPEDLAFLFVSDAMKAKRVTSGD
jgi:hypothetical protein